MVSNAQKRAVLKVAAYIESVLEETPFSIQSVDVGTTEGGFSVSLFLNISQEELQAALDGGVQPYALAAGTTPVASAVRQMVTEITDTLGVPFQFATEDGKDVFDSRNADNLLNLELDGQTDLSAVPSTPAEIHTPAIVIKPRPASKVDDVAAALKKRKPKEVSAEKIVGAGPSFLSKDELQKLSLLYIDGGEDNNG